MPTLGRLSARWEMSDYKLSTDVLTFPQNKSERMPLQLTQRLESVAVRGEAEQGKGGLLVKGGEIKGEGRLPLMARGREVQLAQR